MLWPSSVSPFRRVIASASSSAVSSLISCPFTIVNLQLRASEDASATNLTVLSSVVKEHGFKSLWDGLGVSILARLPAIALNSALEDAFDLQLAPKLRRSNSLTREGSITTAKSITTATVASLVLYPVNHVMLYKRLQHRWPRSDLLLSREFLFRNYSTSLCITLLDSLVFDALFRKVGENSKVVNRSSSSEEYNESENGGDESKSYESAKDEERAKKKYRINLIYLKATLVASGLSSLITYPMSTVYLQQAKAQADDKEGTNRQIPKAMSLNGFFGQLIDHAKSNQGRALLYKGFVFFSIKSLPQTTLSMFINDLILKRL